MTDCKNKRHGHNFIGGVCTRCLVSQDELSYPLKEKNIKLPKPTSYRISTPLQLLVNDIRKDFRETAKKGKGSFGYYMRIFKKLGEEKVREIYSQSKEGDNQKHLFWWLVGKELKRIKLLGIISHIK